MTRGTEGETEKEEATGGTEGETEKEEAAVPPAKKLKLDESGDRGSQTSSCSLERGKDSVTTEGAGHAQSDVAMDTSVSDEKCENHDQQCGVCYIVCVQLHAAGPYP